MDYHKDLKTLLGEALELKNVNLKKLSEATGIPENYIWAIQNVELDKLPPAPYVRGYLKKISATLGLNHDELWELYKKELSHKTSGAHDTLPINRFAIPHVSKTAILCGALGVLLVAYLALRIDRLTGEPRFTIINPPTALFPVSESPLTLTGQLEQRKDKFTINDEEIFIGQDGAFSHEIALQPGLNTIEFKAKRLLGRERTETRQVLYQPIMEEDSGAETPQNNN